jgi:hypothetical protein
MRVLTRILTPWKATPSVTWHPPYNNVPYHSILYRLSDTIDILIENFVIAHIQRLAMLFRLPLPLSF